MKNSDTNLLLRDDTFFGVCEGLGEDLGVPPNLFRVSFALLLFFSPAGAIGGYLGLGLIVALARLIAPNPKPAASRPRESAPPLPTQEGQNENSVEEVPLSAAA